MKIAVVGLGFMGRTHAGALRALPAVRRPAVVPELYALVTRRAAEVRDEATAMGFGRVVTSLEEVLADVDVVDICTPNAMHRELIEMAAAAGKAIYCEKPLAASLADAEAIAAYDGKVMNQVALVYRYLPAVARIKTLMDAGTIGELVQFKATYNHSSYANPKAAKGWRSTAELSGGGGLLDLGVHALDQLLFYVGPLQLKHAETRILIKERVMVPGGPMEPVTVDDWALLHLEAANGAPGVLETSRIALGNECFRIELYGTNGAIVCDLEKETAPRVQTFGPAPAVAEPPSLQYLPPGRLSLGRFFDAHQASLYHFLLRCAGQDPTPAWAPTFAASLSAERIIHQALVK